MGTRGQGNIPPTGGSGGSGAGAGGPNDGRRQALELQAVIAGKSLTQHGMAAREAELKAAFDQLAMQDRMYPEKPDSLRNEIVDLRRTGSGGVVFLQVGSHDENVGLAHLLADRQGHNKTREQQIFGHTGLRGEELVHKIVDIAASGGNTAKVGAGKVRVITADNGFIVTAFSYRT